MENKIQRPQPMQGWPTIYADKNIQSLIKIDPVRLEKEIALCCYNFLKINSTGENIDFISRQFATSIIDTRIDWKLSDVEYFFKFIIQRRDLCGKIFGNRITLLILMDMVFAFENYRSEDREKEHSKFKTDEQNQSIVAASPEVIKKSLEKVYAMTKKVKPLYSPQDNPHQDILAEFDEHYLTHGFDSVGERWITLCGTRHNIDTFLKLRIGEKS